MSKPNLEKDRKLLVYTIRKSSKDLSNFLDDLLTVSKIGQVLKYGKGGLQKVFGKKSKGGAK